MRRATRVPLLVVAVVATVVLAGSAVAYWTGDGGGTTQTRLGDPQALVLSPGVQSAQLFPGDDASVAVVATNPNPYVVHIATLMLDPSGGTDGFDVDGGHAGCGVSSLAFATQDNGGLGWSVPPKAGDTDGSRSIDMDGALTMDVDADNACQGAVFTVHLEAGA